MSTVLSECGDQVERSFWLNSNGCDIYATLHIPKDESVVGAVVLCHAFAEEHKASYRALVMLARALAGSGFCTLRFDHCGCGNSAGNFEDFSITDWLNDIEVAVRWLRNCAPDLPLILAGLRLGATLAALKANDVNADGLVLWQPVINGKRYVQLNMARLRMQRQLIAQEGNASATDNSMSANAMDAHTVEIHRTLRGVEHTERIFTDFNGYLITERLHDELCAIELTDVPFNPSTHCLLVQISGSTKLSRELVQLQEHIQSYGAPCEVLTIREQPIWSLLGLVDPRELIHETTRWMVREFGDGERASSLAIQSTAGQVRSESRGEQIVTIPTERGWLRGILSSSSNSPLGIIFLHGWSGNRAGPHQMFVKLARRLYDAGYTTLRFDFYGRGESAGEIANGTLLTMIQDAQVAVDWLVERTNVQRCILLGICSGGEVAVGAALHPDVVGIVLWSTPIFARLRERGRALRKKWGYVKEYARKLFRITTWRKLFAGQLQFGIILRVLFGRTDEQPMRKEESDANRVERKHEADRKSITQPADAAPVEALERDREQLEAILAQFMKQFAKPVLMVYGTNDPDTNPATAWYRDIFESTGAPHHVHLVHGANHSYYSVAWEQEVFDVTRTWLEQLASESAHN